MLSGHMDTLIPRQKTPSLAVETLKKRAFDLSAQSADRGTVACFYRGLHRPICANYLSEFEKQKPSFKDCRVGTNGISSDDKERTQAMAANINSTNLKFGD